jgi:hypothetical protein
MDSILCRATAMSGCGDLFVVGHAVIGRMSCGD